MNEKFLADIGWVFSLSLAAMGSAFGTAAAGMSALGAWRRCYLEKRPAPFILVAFVGAPLSQIIYGMILMNAIRAIPSGFPPMSAMFVGLLGGTAMGLSAWLQGRAGALAADALAETGAGFGNYIMVIGVIETTALFVMVFLMTAIG